MDEGASDVDGDVFDVVVVGAGFSGLHMLHRVLESGLRVCVLERSDVVGGTWAVNRYPGARCDIESVEYSYSFSEAVEAEWTWTDVLPAQAEIEAYLNFVADRLDLRRHIRFGSDVVGMSFDEATDRWRLEIAGSAPVQARFVVAATGILSAPVGPTSPGWTASPATPSSAARSRARATTSPASGWRSSAPAPPACRPRRSSPRWRTTSTCSSARRPTRCRPAPGRTAPASSRSCGPATRRSGRPSGRRSSAPPAPAPSPP